MADVNGTFYQASKVRIGTSPSSPGLITGTVPSSPVNPDGTGSVHLPVTIGSPANGLSITGNQVLTLEIGDGLGVDGYGRLEATGGGGGISGTIASGQVAFGTGANTIGGDGSLLWDDTNKRLSIVNGAISGARLGGDINLTGSITNAVTKFFRFSMPHRDSATEEDISLFSFAGGGVNNVLTFGGGSGSLNALTNIEFWTGANNVTLNGTLRWSIISNGSFQSNGDGRILTSSNGNILLTPNGTGLTLIGPLATPTNTLDVNGTARIRTVSNLGSTATRFAVLSATGVVSERTAAEMRADIGAASLSGLTTNRIVKATSATTVGNTDITEESTASYLFGNRSVSSTSTPLCVSFGGTFGNNTAGSEGNLKWKMYDAGVGTAYGIGMVSGGMEFSIPNANFSFFPNRTRAMTIATNGNVIIGSSTTSPTFKLLVENQTQITSANNLITLSLGSSLATGTAGSAGNVKLAVYDAGVGTQYGFGVSSANFQMISGGAINFYPSYTQVLTLSSTLITVANGINLVFNTATGTRIGTATSQKLAFWNKTPIVQPTNAIAEVAFVENAGGTAVNVDSTFGGYTLQQIAQALINVGLLA